MQGRRARVSSCVRLLGLLLAGLLGSCGTGEPDDTVVVKREDLVLGVDVTGTLRAVETRSYGAPVVGDVWDFKITFMAPEGAEAKAGSVVLRFDTGDLEHKLDEKLNEQKAVEKELDKRGSDAELARRDAELRLAEVSAKVRKAELAVAVPADLQNALELRAARLDLELARKEDRSVRERNRHAAHVDDVELAGLRERRDRARQRVTELRAQLGEMQVKTARAGTVIYRVLRNDEKKKVGGSTWRGESVLEVAGLGDMLGAGEIDEADSSRVAVGQRVHLRLDAHPDQEWTGTVKTVQQTVQRTSAKNPLKVVRLDLALDRADAMRMRPGMRFRGQVETGRAPAVLVVPSEAVFLGPAGAMAYRRRAGGFDAVPVKLGRRSRERVEVVAGLAEGDVVSRREPEKTRP